jgi:OOP family OmpA-OmpF porin
VTAERIEVVGHLDPAGVKPETQADPVADEAAKETAPKPAKPDPKKDAKANKGKAKAETKQEASKSEQKSEPKSEPKPEKTEAERADAGADLARARALAVIWGLAPEAPGPSEGGDGQVTSAG